MPGAQLETGTHIVVWYDPMNNAVLYLSTVLIWGSTWLAITFQLGSVDPLISVGYRFALAAALLLSYCLFTRKRMRFTLYEHLYMALLGASLFGINYWLFYLVTQHLTSGLVAVTFSTVVLMNAFNGRLFLGNRIQSHVMVAAAIGLGGIALVFWKEIVSFSLGSETSFALGLAFLATYSASLGNIISARNQRSGLPILQANAYGMAYGAVLMFCVALVNGNPVSFDWSFSYLASLVYLAVFGSIAAFGAYLTLVGRLGADKAAYASLLFPIVALQLSVWFEAYQWTAQSVMGLLLILLGNLIILAPPGRLGITRRSNAA